MSNSQQQTDSRRPQVVIVGAGFGGLRAARALRRAAVQITLVDRHNYHLFQPLLYQVATAGLGPSDIAHPVRAILQDQRNCDLLLAEATGADLAGRLLRTTAGDVGYDHLVIAVGGQTNYFGNDRLADSAFGLKDLDDAIRIRNHVLYQFEQAVHERRPEVRQAMLTFVIVGGGPTGVECAGALSELIRLVLVKDYRGLNVKDVRVVLLEATDRILGPFDEKLRESAARALWSKFIEVRFSAAVDRFDGQAVTLKSGELIPSRTMVWAAGVRGVSLLDAFGLPQDRLGRIRVGPTLQPAGQPDVYVVGDAACVEEEGHRPPPMVAAVAIQQGQTVAASIARALGGQPPLPFRYRDRGSLATIGRSAAVAQIGRLRFRGRAAWVAWLIVHIIYLIGFRSRMLVLINWAWDYLFYDRAVRLIMHDGNCPWAPLHGACVGGQREGAVLTPAPPA
jgi:NADH:ubiquinone reductase (H+-translocating)